MAFPATVAVFGDPTKPFGEGVDYPDEWEKPYRERLKVELEVDEDETLGSVLGRAAEEVDARIDWPDTTISDALAFTAFYHPEDEERFSGWHSAVTLVDDEGRAVWTNYFKPVRYVDLVRSAEAGALEGDPLRPYLILHPGIGNGVTAGWETLVQLWDIAWLIWERIDVAAGGAAGIYAAKKLLVDRIRQRTRSGREAVWRRHKEWENRNGEPASVAQWLRERPRTSEQASRLLGCSQEEAEAVLWAFGLAPDPETGLWKPGQNEEAKFLAGNAEMIVHGFDYFRFEIEFRTRFQEFIRTGRAPDVDWREAENVPTWRRLLSGRILAPLSSARARRRR